MPIPEQPLTRKEMYLNSAAGGSGTIPETPLTREEQYLDAIAKNGGGGGTSGGGVLVANVNMQTGALDKTWQEIHDAPVAVLVMESQFEEGVTQTLYKAGDANDETYGCDVTFSVFFREGVSYSYTFITDSPSGYPVLDNPVNSGVN